MIEKLRDNLQSMLEDEQATIKAQLQHVTRDPPLVRAEIRAELLREIIQLTIKKENDHGQSKN